MFSASTLESHGQPPCNAQSVDAALFPETPTNLCTGYLRRGWTNTDLLLSFWFPAFKGRVWPRLYRPHSWEQGWSLQLLGGHFQAEKWIPPEGATSKKHTQKSVCQGAMVTWNVWTGFMTLCTVLDEVLGHNFFDSFLSLRKCNTDQCVSCLFYKKKWTYNILICRNAYLKYFNCILKCHTCKVLHHTCHYRSFKKIQSCF